MEYLSVFILVILLVFAPLASIKFKSPYIMIGAIAACSLAKVVLDREWRYIPADSGFADMSGSDSTAGFQGDASEKVILETTVEKPYALDPIRSLDDYEYNMIFQNEGDRGITKRQRDALMSKYPMDWSVQPPSSELFQQGLAKFKESFENPPPAPTGNPYKKIDGSQMIPPDNSHIEKQEREILATYVPKDPKSLTTYDAADAAELIHKIYDAKGLVPQYKQTGPNQFTIVNTMKKGEEVVWEEEAPAAVQTAGVADTSANPAQGEGTIIVPAMAQEMQTGLDPFFTADPNSKTRDGRWNYNRWTPGLERMFAPTESQTNWY